MTKRHTLSLLITLLTLLFVLPLIAQETWAGAFPVTVTHKFGSTTITEEPLHPRVSGVSNPE